MFRLAHVTDAHLGPLPRPRWRELASKRVLGYVNWRLNRGGRHADGVVDELVEDMARHEPDHIAVTGDLVNIAMPHEFETALAFLELMGPDDRVSFVPGNHDAYVRATASHPQRIWGHYMTGDGEEGPTFPYVRRRGPIALVGVSSAIPTAPFSASGRLGPEQCRRLEDTLAALTSEGLFRIVMIHHPPTAYEQARVRRLIDVRQVSDAIARGGAELVIHGHEHLFQKTEIYAGGARIPVLGAPSCTRGYGKRRSGGGYLVYEVDGEAGAWTCNALLRTPRRSGGYETSWSETL